MNKLLDLRFVIGSFFAITGLLLMIYYLFTMNDVHEKEDAVSGELVIVFGLGMILLSYKKGKEH